MTTERHKLNTKTSTRTKTQNGYKETQNNKRDSVELQKQTKIHR